MLCMARILHTNLAHITITLKTMNTQITTYLTSTIQMDTRNKDRAPTTTQLTPPATPLIVPVHTMATCTHITINHLTRITHTVQVLQVTLTMGLLPCKMIMLLSPRTTLHRTTINLVVHNPTILIHTIALDHTPITHHLITTQAQQAPIAQPHTTTAVRELTYTTTLITLAVDHITTMHLRTIMQAGQALTVTIPITLVEPTLTSAHRITIRQAQMAHHITQIRTTTPLPQMLQAPTTIFLTKIME